MKRYSGQQSGYYILATDYDLDIPNLYPAVYDHLKSIGEQIESGEIRTRGKGLYNRDDQGQNWWNLRACAYYEEFDKVKIVYPDIYRNPSFTVDTNGSYCSNTCYFIPTEDTWLCGVLNSKTVEWYYSRLANTLGSGASRGFSIFMQQIRIPNIDSYQKTIITNHVNNILEAKAADPEADTSNLENEIDKLVYDLCGLDDEEIAIVEGRI